MVVVVMALLLVAASATYYVVRNQHMSANTHYASEQSYQTAYSVSKTMESYLVEAASDVSANPSKYKGSILQKLMAMTPGETGALTAGNDFKEYGLGEYDIRIVKDPSSTDEEALFNITTKAEANGETSTLTQVWRIKLEAAETKYFTRFLTTTGIGVMEDTFVQCQRIYGEAYFENEFTVINNPARVNRSVYSSGTLIDVGWEFEDTADKELVVAGNYYLDGVGGNPVELKQIFVGGDFMQKSTKPIDADGIYIEGDFKYTSNGAALKSNVFVQGNCYINGYVGSDNTFYVNGDLHLGKDLGETGWSAGKVGTVYVKGDVYFDSPGENGSSLNIFYGGEVHGAPTYAVPLTEKSDILSTTETALGTVSGGLVNNWNEVSLYVSNQTAVGTYQEWDAEGLFDTGGDFENAPTIDIDNAILGAYIGNNDVGWSITNPSSVDLTSTGKGSIVNKPDGSNICATIKESCKLKHSDYMPQGGCIIVDATDDDVYIYLDSGTDDTFSFFNNPACSVYVKGTHSAIFVLPTGTNFKGGTQQYIGHFDLANKINGWDSNFTGLNVWWQSAMTSVDDYNAKLGESVFKYAYDEDGTEYKYLDSAKFNGAQVHNNVFLVTKDKNSNIDFNNSCMLAGYIYAPNVRMDIGNGGGGMTQFFGGLIVGSYKYINTSAILVFCSPYDPYNTYEYTDPETGAKRTEIVGPNVVSNLISKASGGTLNDSDSPSGGKQNVTVELLGYK